MKFLGNLNPEDDEQLTIGFSTRDDEIIVANPVVTVTIVDDD